MVIIKLKQNRVIELGQRGFWHKIKHQSFFLEGVLFSGDKSNFPFTLIGSPRWVNLIGVVEIGNHMLDSLYHCRCWIYWSCFLDQWTNVNSFQSSERGTIWKNKEQSVICILQSDNIFFILLMVFRQKVLNETYYKKWIKDTINP